MKALRYGITCLLAAALASIAACGGSSDDNDGSGGGTSAGGASHSGGAPGAAGRVATGGTTNGGNNPACPAAPPANATACTVTSGQTTCDYSGASCRCARAGGGAMREWQCTTTLVCPAQKPTVGEACTPAPGSCQYAGMASCNCGLTSKWACRGGVISGGGGAGGAFNGGFGGRFSFGGAPGTGSAGSAAGSKCPATKPAADSACTGTDACPYTGGGCVCSGDKWTCL